MAELPFQYTDWGWVATYKGAVLEVDDAKLIEKIDDAEAVISLRVQALNGTSKPEERRALADAVRALRILRQERLGHRK